ncbi:ABC transporter permease subunit [Streptomyces lonarensis]|uniref:ABC transporter permease subunit n=2 Tax=Streptomyces lonarensis TaxID=700599 RepID=A0A7X6D2Y9_9ACTN|nr:ABC transporter permease subunit [Streptomyces lonarensis]
MPNDHAADPATTGGTPAGHAAGNATARGDARIHNIGYRGYDGPRLGRSHARRALVEQSVRGAFGIGRSAKSKILPMLLLAIMVFPAVIMVAVSLVTNTDELPLEYTRYAVMLQPVLGLYIALAAPQMVSLDLRYRTIPLYFSRPLERADYVASKLTALSIAIFLFTALPLLVLYVGALLAELDAGDQTVGFLQGIAGAVVFALLHAAIALLVASLTPRRGFGVAAVIAVLTVPFFAATSLQWILHDLGNDTAAGWVGLLSPGTLMDGIQGAYLGGATDFPPGADPSAGGMGLAYLLVTVGLTALCAFLLLRRYRKEGI